MVKVTETLIDGDPERYEQRYLLPVLRSAIGFVRRPVSITPPEGWVGIVDNGPRLGTLPKSTGAYFKDGKFHRVRFQPTHWTDLELEAKDG